MSWDRTLALASLLCSIVCSAREPVIRIATFVIAYPHFTEDLDESDVDIGAYDWCRCRCRPRLAAGAAAIVAGDRGAGEAIPVSGDPRPTRRHTAGSAAPPVAAARRRALDIVHARAA